MTSITALKQFSGTKVLIGGLSVMLGLPIFLAAGYWGRDALLAVARSLCHFFDALVFHENFSILLVACQVAIIPTVLGLLFLPPVVRRLASFQRWVVGVVACTVWTASLFLPFELRDGDGGTGTVVLLVVLLPLLVWLCRPATFESVRYSSNWSRERFTAGLMAYGFAAAWVLVRFMVTKAWPTG
jgi:hypothetical protein